MGRGRAKAKQTKLARELKYRTVSTDLTSLERELRGADGEIPDPYVELASEYDEYLTDDDLDDEDDLDEGDNH